MAVLRSLLMLHNEPEAFRELQDTLCKRGIRIWHAHDCAEARRILESKEPIDLVFTDAKLPDGTWNDAVCLVRKAASVAPVIVMSRFVNMQLYLDTQDGGAADFVVPPISHRDLAHVLAVVMSRRRTESHVDAPVRHQESAGRVRNSSRDSSKTYSGVERAACD